MVTKKEIRSEILKQRRSLTDSEVQRLSEEICSKVMSTDLYKNSRDICVYMPINNEVDAELVAVSAMKSSTDKRFWVPKVIGSEMVFNRYEGSDNMVTGAYDIRESVSDEILKPDSDTLILMPGAVFSIYKDRIGYGGGYYDKYLARNPEVKTTALCFDFQIRNEIPTEEHDKKPDIIVSDKRVIK